MAEAFGIGAGVVGIIGLTIQIAQVVVQFGLDCNDAPDNVKKFMAELRGLNAVLSQINSSIVVNPEYAAAFEGRSSLLLSQLHASPSQVPKSLLQTCQEELEKLLAELKKRDKGGKWGLTRLKVAFFAKNTRDAVEDLHRKCQVLHEMIMVDAAVLAVDTNKEIKEAIKKQYEWHLEESEAISAIRDGVDQLYDRQEELHDAGEKLSFDMKDCMSSLFNQQVKSHRDQKNAMSAVKDAVDALKLESDRHHANEERTKILNWVAPFDDTIQQNYFRQQKKGTGQWFLDSVEFKAWVETEKQTLFCPGIPGAGKTILTSIVINELTSRFGNDDSFGIAYIYCNFRRKHSQTAEDLLANLLRQLAQNRQSLPKSVHSLYDDCKGQRPSVDEISTTLQSASEMYSKVYLVIDALDECETLEGCRSTFLEAIFDLQAKCKANVFATSRFIPEIMEEFDGCVQLEIHAKAEDVGLYVDSRMSHLPSFVRSRQDLQKEIKTEIIQTVDGRFLLAQLRFNSLVGTTTPNQLRAALKQWSTNSEVLGAYDHAYDETMERIKAVPYQSELAMQVLSWITYTKMPLTSTELQHALAVKPGKPNLDEDDLPEIEGMVSVCSGLVTIDKGSNIIRLVHYTTQQYFERTQNRWFDNAQAAITTICTTYLSFSVFESGFCQKDDEFEERLRSNPLYDYAAHYWGHHACDLSNFPEQILDFLRLEKNVEASSQALMAVEGFSGQRRFSQGAPKEMTGVHLAAYLGVTEGVRILTREQNPDAKDSHNRTPLSWAAERGHTDVVKLLLDNGTVDVNSTDKHFGLTPLSYAAGEGHQAVVKILLAAKEVDLNSKDTSFGLTPLEHAEENEHMEIAGLLRESGGVGSNSKSGSDHESFSYSSPLVSELGDDMDIVVETLSAADVTWHGQIRRKSYRREKSPYFDERDKLANANYYGDWKAMDVQLTIGFNHYHQNWSSCWRISSSTKSVNGASGFTPLHQAAWWGNEEAVQKLLSLGAWSTALQDSENYFNVKTIQQTSRCRSRPETKALVLIIIFRAQPFCQPRNATGSPE
ncbi:hypothetical protein BKA56DRAFT_259996 [Ilyonectria sp. MPI-CAGE-AT-0026]|nr:hypothetical protein BKA56DRAFT_259996 [Ilyonectria sp. MPI-CAGE-AT-0026]